MAAQHAFTARPAVGQPPTAGRQELELGDLRFRALLTPHAWGLLPPAIRHRFSKRLSGGRTIVYVGTIVDTQMSRIGWCLAQAARLIGAPLPTSLDRHVPSVVTVTEDVVTSGQIWTRMYARQRGFPQIINSSKRFSGPTGLEEYIGYGISMALSVHTSATSLTFQSAGYAVDLGARRIKFPNWLAPFSVKVTHTDLGRGHFEFKLDVANPRFGTLITQSAIFADAPAALDPTDA
jgi:Domain of unknown function (DUF4166)